MNHKTSLKSQVREMDADELEEVAQTYEPKIQSKSLSEEDVEILNVISNQYKQLTGSEIVFENHIQIVS